MYELNLLFSTAGDVLTDSRSRLLPERAEHLIFLKINLPLLNNSFRTRSQMTECDSDSSSDDN